MLELLRIKNIAVIDQTEIPFQDGFNVISGETGAGKSIVIESIGLILGGRAQTDLIRSGCEDATVEGVFDLSKRSVTKQLLVDNGFPADSDELLIKRILSKSGKHRIYINGELANLQSLQRVTEGLIDCCGQHENQSLLKQTSQMELLDRFGGLESQALALSTLVRKMKELSSELATLESSKTEQVRKTEFLKFQIEELESLDLKVGEEESLQEEKKLFSSVGARQASVQFIVDGLDEQLGALRSMLGKARSLQNQDPTAEPMVQGLERGTIEIEEASLQFSKYLNGIDFSDERMNEVQTRLAKYAELRRKYICSGDELVSRLSQMKSELQSLESVGDSIESVRAELDQTLEALKSAGDKLIKARKKSAKSISEQVTKELRELRMEQAEFQVELKEVADLSEWSEKLGPQTIQFNIRTNAGDALSPIGSIASGGELSRVLLSIRRVIADQGGIGVYLFDEIDAGIGGQTAFVVGRKLKSVAKHNQVICITHVPQVAAFADHHLSVVKTVDKKKTFTEVKELSAKDRTDELARMLGGEVITRKSLDNAKELLAASR